MDRPSRRRRRRHAAAADVAVQRGDHAEGGGEAAAAAGRAGPRHGRVPHVPAAHAVGADGGGRPRRSPTPGCGRCRTSRPAPCPTGQRCGACSPTSPRSASTDLLVLAGSLATPVGEFHETAQILDSGLLEEAGIVRVGIVGHPEGHPDVARRRAGPGAGGEVPASPGSAASTCTWSPSSPSRPSRSSRGSADPRAGVDVPVHVGLPGLTSPTRLLRFGLWCGVGASLKVLRQQAGGVLKLATSPVHHPDETLRRPGRRRRPPTPKACCGPCTSSRSARSRPPRRGRATSATAASSCPTATACA